MSRIVVHDNKQGDNRASDLFPSVNRTRNEDKRDYVLRNGPRTQWRGITNLPLLEPIIRLDPLPFLINDLLPSARVDTFQRLTPLGPRSVAAGA